MRSTKPQHPLRAEAAQHLIGTALHEVQAGARGGAGATVADQVAMRLDPSDRGTLMHELVSWGLFLKQTPLGIFKTHMFDVPRGLDDWRSAMAYRAKFMAGSAALGALSLELKTSSMGRTPEDLATRKGLGKILIASGGLGMYGDFMFGDKGDHQNGALAKLLGPGATMIEDAVNIFHNGIDTARGAAGVDAEPGEQTVRPDQFGAQVARFSRNYVAPLTHLVPEGGIHPSRLQQRHGEPVARLPRPCAPAHGAAQSNELVGAGREYTGWGSRLLRSVRRQIG
jgi:hypothetical protein